MHPRAEDNLRRMAKPLDLCGRVREQRVILHHTPALFRNSFKIIKDGLVGHQPLLRDDLGERSLRQLLPTRNQEV